LQRPTKTGIHLANNSNLEGVDYLDENRRFYSASIGVSSPEIVANDSTGTSGGYMGLMFDSLTNRVLVLCANGSQGVDVVNASNDAPISENLTNSKGYCAADLDPRNGEVYLIGFEGPGDIEAVNGTTLAPIANILRATEVTGYAIPDALAYNASGGVFYSVPEWNGDTFPSTSLVTINATTNRVVSNVSELQSLFGWTLAYSPKSGELYVHADSTSWNVSVLRPENGTLAGAVSGLDDSPWFYTDFVYDPANGYIYAPTNSPTMTVFSTLNNSFVGNISELPYGTNQAVYDPQNEYLYAIGDGALTTIDTRTDSVLGTLTFDPTPCGGQLCLDSIAYDSNSGNLYISGSNASAGAGYLWELDPGPAPVDLTATPGSGEVDVGDWANFTFSVGSHGLPYTVTWSGLPGCAGGNVTNLTCHLTESGTFVVKATATDPYGASNTAVLVFEVGADPSLANLTVTPLDGSVDVGQLVVFNATALGGVGNATFAWTSIPSGLACVPSTTDELNCTATAPGNYSVQVSWTDGSGRSSPIDTTPAVRVWPDPGIEGVAATSSSVDVGQDVTFTAETTGGSGGGVFAWTWSPFLECSTNSSATLVCAPITPGSAYSVSVQWTDSNGETSPTQSLSDYTVWTDPTLLSVTANREQLDVGQTVEFTANVTGGSGGGVFTWSGDLASLGCAPSVGALLNCTPPAPTSPSVGATVSASWTDGNGVTTARLTSMVVWVAADPKVTGVSVAPSGTVAVGTDVTFTAETSGGSGVGTYAWSGIPSGLACPGTDSSTLTCTADAVGSGYRVNVSWTDGVGEASSTEESPPVTVATASTGSSALPAWELVALIGVGAVVVVGVGVALWRRRSAGSPTTTDSEPNTEADSGPPLE
jgi:hypothetical protein